MNQVARNSEKQVKVLPPNCILFALSIHYSSQFGQMIPKSEFKGNPSEDGFSQALSWWNSQFAVLFHTFFFNTFIWLFSPDTITVYIQ